MGRNGADEKVGNKEKTGRGRKGSHQGKRGEIARDMAGEEKSQNEEEREKRRTLPEHKKAKQSQSYLGASLENVKKKPQSCTVMR